uniref:Dolichyl-diphosphooligosaccharide--protein glycosyltransferase subunit MAGT1 n=1 Tax=Strongyloides stercoralis TaxID=6248 RepID=A0A0K0DX98_STRER
MFHTVYLTIIGICFTVCCYGGQLTLEDKISNLQDSLYRRPMMSLNTEKFKQYVSSSPRNYSIIAMFTALSPQMNCQVCKPAYDEYEVLANSYRHQYPEAKKLYFVMVDYADAPEIFASINLNTAPAFIHFPAKGSRKSDDTMDVQINGFEADVLARFVKERTEISINIVRPPNYGAPIMILLFLLMIVSILYIRRDNLDFLYNRSAWGAFCLFLVFAFMSGQMWNHIRGPPFAINNPKTGSATFIHSSTQYQLISETYIVGGLYALVTIGFILLTDAAVDDNKTSPKQSPILKRNIIVFVGLLITIVGFSLLLSVFRSKHRGYPYSLLFS